MATSMLESYDSAFLGILQHEGNLPNFLDVVFGFLYRRTDYYRIMKTKEDKLGFPPGVALKLTVKAFQKYADQAEKDEELRSQLQNLETLKGEQNAEHGDECEDLRADLDNRMQPNSYGDYCICFPRSDAESEEDLYMTYGKFGKLMHVSNKSRYTFVFFSEKSNAIEAYVEQSKTVDMKLVREKLSPIGSTEPEEEPHILGGTTRTISCPVPPTPEATTSNSSVDAKPIVATSASHSNGQNTANGEKALTLVCEYFPYKTHFKDLFKAFRQFGKVKVNVLNNSPPKQTYALVSFCDETALSAALLLDGEIFKGQEMSIRRFDPSLPKDKAYNMIANQDKTTRLQNKRKRTSCGMTETAPSRYDEFSPAAYETNVSIFHPTRGRGPERNHRTNYYSYENSADRYHPQRLRFLPY